MRVLRAICNFGWLMFFFAMGKGLHILFTDDNDSIVFAILFGFIGLGIGLGLNAVINKGSGEIAATVPTKKD